jgi:hypothetical protein
VRWFFFLSIGKLRFWWLFRSKMSFCGVEISRGFAVAVRHVLLEPHVVKDSIGESSIIA